LDFFIPPSLYSTYLLYIPIILIISLPLDICSTLEAPDDFCLNFQS
jgi:hypothetical protein